MVVATTALCMGVNFPDIRYIISWGAARSLLDFHQEAGRAGRDGVLSHVVIIYHGQQVGPCEKEVKHFIRTTGCLRVGVECFMASHNMVKTEYTHSFLYFVLPCHVDFCTCIAIGKQRA